MKEKTSAVIFGGTGFIGAFFSQYLLKNKYVDQIYLVDIESANEKNFEFRKNQIMSDQRISFIRADVRKSLDFKVSGKVKIIANFAAIHREPGHQKFEYFETNINGADFVCKFSERVKCENIIFSSSIAPYGSSEDIKDERSIPIPDSPYGCSKLVAEKIHQIWQAKDKNRYLTIVRPGVVFGPGEGGNVSRLIKAVIHKYFCYIGNKNTIKAGIYVKELCRAMLWVHEKQKSEKVMYVLFNMTMDSSPTVENYVKAICKTAKIK
jgi:nucleoside-diphosphate-sugar epimerase